MICPQSYLHLSPNFSDFGAIPSHSKNSDTLLLKSRLKRELHESLIRVLWERLNAVEELIDGRISRFLKIKNCNVSYMAQEAIEELAQIAVWNKRAFKTHFFIPLWK